MSNQPDQGGAASIADRISAIRERVAEHEGDEPMKEHRMEGPQFEKWGKEDPMPWKQEQWNKLS